MATKIEEQDDSFVIFETVIGACVLSCRIANGTAGWLWSLIDDAGFEHSYPIGVAFVKGHAAGFVSLYIGPIFINFGYPKEG